MATDPTKFTRKPKAKKAKVKARPPPKPKRTKAQQARAVLDSGRRLSTAERRALRSLLDR